MFALLNGLDRKGFFIKMLKNKYLYLPVVLLVLFSYYTSVFSSDLYSEALISISPKTKYAVIVDKSLQKLFLYKTEDRSNILTLDCATGERKGRKRVEGDKKTPEGVYFFTARYEDKDLTPVYGTKAFPIDYPNAIDSLMGRNGDAIWLHGTDKKPLVKRSSNGCIALNNSDINKLDPYLKLKDTPFIILKSATIVPTENKKKVLKTVSALLGDWKNAVEKGTYHYFLSFYDHSYFPDISFWREWLKIRTLNRDFSFEISDSSIFKHDDYYIVKFDLKILKGKFKGEKVSKKLFLKNVEGTLKIIGDEDLYVLSRNRKVYTGFIKAVKKTAYNAKVKLEYDKKQKLLSDIMSQTKKWIKAWSDGDIETYKGFYSKDFYSKAYKMDLKRWVQHKKTLKSRYKYINISMEKVTIDIFKTIIKIVFTQKYSSSGYNEIGTKKLFLKSEGDKWKIYRELWTKNY